MPTTYTVSSLADSGAGTLRAAITSANSDTTVDEIDFSIAGVIKLTSGALPAITNTVKIDGTTALGFAGAPVIEIDNNGFGGLILTASNSGLAGLSIVNANGAGVTLEGFPGSMAVSGIGSNISVVGNYIGLALDGSIAGNTGVGLQLTDSFSTIGGTSPADRNVISGNGAGGIRVVSSSGPLLEGALIEGNYIGTDPTGQAAAPNQGNGITVSGEFSAIGGMDPGAGNIIAFNTESGIMMNPGNGVLSNSIFNNGSKGIDIQAVQFNNTPNIPAPQLIYAVESPGSAANSVQIQVAGTLNVPNSLPFDSSNVAYTIQVFATLKGVPAGQGQLFLGSAQVTTNASGFATFTLNASVPAGSGTTFTATANTPLVITIDNSSEFSAAHAIGGDTNSLFVASAYELLLNRAPDIGGGFWVNLMYSGDSAAGVVQGIEGSTEYLNDQVAAMYKRYLGRNADTGGEQAWTNFLIAGGTLEQVAEGLASSQEYFALQGGTNQTFLIGLYVDALHRGPSTSELAGWETALDAGFSRSSVASTFLTAQEYRTDLVQNDYMTFLLRAADSGGVTAWVEALNAGATDQQVLAQIFGSAEGYQVWS